ncbi:hypothetical protein [Methylobacterium sp. 22177]|uniref:hypothetical protein n=1 Tax=Methylobacterium sp. 22177 TaxID=3453885 RepID=UPI000B09F8CC
MHHARSDDLPALLLALATENAELRLQLGEAVQIERDAWHTQAVQLQTRLQREG